MWDTERIKRFWEACGFLTGANGAFTMGWYKYPDSLLLRDELPDITDLNALFKWAVPKVQEKMAKYKVMHLLKDWVEAIVIWDKDPAQALAEAIEKALIGEHDSKTEA